MSKQTFCRLIVAYVFLAGVSGHTLQCEAKDSQAPSSIAQDEASAPSGAIKRKSYASLFLTGGEHDYRDGLLNAGLGLDPQWLITGKIEGTSNGSDSKSSEVRGGADDRATECFWPRGSIFLKREPNEISAFGFSLGSALNLNELLKSETKTQFFADFESTRYKQTDVQSRATRNRIGSAAYLQKSLVVGLTQEILETLVLTATFTHYAYSKDPAVLSQAINSRALAINGIAGLVAGFPRRSASLEGDWDFAEGWLAVLTASSTTLAADNSKTNALSMEFSHDFNEYWSGKLVASESRAQSGDRTSEIGVGATYSW